MQQVSNMAQDVVAVARVVMTAERLFIMYCGVQLFFRW